MASQQDSQPFRWHYDDLDDRNFQIRGRTLFFVIVLFSVVLLIALLFLYARWICRSPVLPIATDSARAPAAAAGARGLDQATIESFPIVLHRLSAASVNEVECCICLGVFSEGEKIKVLPDCNHFYHPECVDKWLNTQSSCPLCRAPLKSDSLV